MSQNTDHIQTINNNYKYWFAERLAIQLALSQLFYSVIEVKEKKNKTMINETIAKQTKIKANKLAKVLKENKTNQTIRRTQT